MSGNEYGQFEPRPDDAQAPLDAALRAALAPEELPPRLTQRIARELDARMRPPRRSYWTRRLAPALAVAAALMLLAVWPNPNTQLTPLANTFAPQSVSNPFDDWTADVTLDLALYEVGVEADAASADMERVTVDASYLSWNEAESWDRPKVADGAL